MEGLLAFSLFKRVAFSAQQDLFDSWPSNYDMIERKSLLFAPAQPSMACTYRRANHVSVCPLHMQRANTRLFQSWQSLQNTSHKLCQKYTSPLSFLLNKISNFWRTLPRDQTLDCPRFLQSMMVLYILSIPPPWFSIDHFSCSEKKKIPEAQTSIHFLWGSGRSTSIFSPKKVLGERWQSKDGHCQFLAKTIPNYLVCHRKQ